MMSTSSSQIHIWKITVLTADTSYGCQSRKHRERLQQQNRNQDKEVDSFHAKVFL